jgi:hypothetical protein
MPVVTTRRNITVDEHGIMRSPLGYRCGESHPKARLTDAQVAEMRSARDQGAPMKVLAIQFAVSYWTVAKICRYERRNVTLRNYDD